MISFIILNFLQSKPCKNNNYKSHQNRAIKAKIMLIHETNPTVAVVNPHFFKGCLIGHHSILVAPC